MLIKIQRGDIGFLDALDQLCQSEIARRNCYATSLRITKSKIKRGAAVEDFDFTFPRNVTRLQIQELVKLNWCEQGQPVILVGPTGVGKTFLARSLGLLACEKGISTLFLSITDFLEHQRLARSSHGYLKFRERLAKPGLLILDDFGLRKFGPEEAEDLRDLIEMRSYGKSTMITTQLPFQHWMEVIPDEIILDALVDRLKPQGLMVELKGDSFRQRKKTGVAKSEINQ